MDGSQMMPYHVRTADDVPWQQYYFCQIESTNPGTGFGCSGLRIQCLTGSTCNFHPCFKYKFTNSSETTAVMDTMLFDEVNKKLYFFHSPNDDANFTVREATVEIKKEQNGSRTIADFHSIRLFLGSSGIKKEGVDAKLRRVMIQWFLNSVDGSIFQIKSTKLNPLASVAFYTLSWIELDDGIQVDADSGVYAGKVKLMHKLQFQFPHLNILDNDECGILFSEGGKKLLMRFRFPNPNFFDYDPSDFEVLKKNNVIKKGMQTPFTSLTHQMTKPPSYAIFGLNYDSHTMQLLTQFVPSSPENHCDFLISAQLLPVYGNGIGFPNSAARSFLSQRSHMIGQYLKYTFFSTTTNKGAIGIVAVKSVVKALENGQLLLTPKKVWFPLEDVKFKTAFGNLAEQNIKRDMLTQQHNVMLVVGNEFVLQVLHPDVNVKPTCQLATIRVKLGVEYKDYRRCGGCGIIEPHKRRSKNGKRISKFKVCGWCKDHNLHKTLEIPCHYCSEECADSHWPIHQLEHNVKQKGLKSNGKKGKGKKNTTKK